VRYYHSWFCADYCDCHSVSWTQGREKRARTSHYTRSIPSRFDRRARGQSPFFVARKPLEGAQVSMYPHDAARWSFDRSRYSRK